MQISKVILPRGTRAWESEKVNEGCDRVEEQEWIPCNDCSRPESSNLQVSDRLVAMDVYPSHISVTDNTTGEIRKKGHGRWQNRRSLAE